MKMQSKRDMGWSWALLAVLGAAVSWGCDIGNDRIGDDVADEGSESNDTDDDETTTVNDEGTEGDEPITNACGSFDPDDTHGESTIPQDPDDPEILAACTALCEVELAGIAGCTTSADACLQTCKMRSCEVCPGTLVPLVECQAAMFTDDGCTCTADGIECPIPDGCHDLDVATGFCGG
ncbi:MAG TPA: hypothetical protein VK034_19600 [Enhygromyxa sp.]|nr:hypothetical protein [Enhygromyxa sp.]